MKFTAWDVVLTDLQPGAYMLRGVVSNDADLYTWNINLVIEDQTVSE